MGYQKNYYEKIIHLKVICIAFILISSSVNSQEINPKKVFNLGFNTEYAEFGAKFYQNDMLLFASSMIDESISRKERRNNRQMYLKFYKGFITEDGEVIQVQSFTGQQNNPIHEADITFAADHKTVYFTRNNYIIDDYNKIFRQSASEDHILHIFKASINANGELSNAISMPFNGSDYSVSNPYLSSDGKKLFFVSNMESSYGGTDIYMVDILADGSYSDPKNLGSEINSKEDEIFPFLSENNTLYFSSTGHKGKGEFDIYSSIITNGNYGAPTNMGAPINSEYDDFAFVLSQSNNVGYFSSTRDNGKGNADIYGFQIIPTVVEEEEIIVADVEEALSGTSVENNAEAIDDAVVLVTDTNLPPTISESGTTTPITPIPVVIETPCEQVIEGIVVDTKNNLLNNVQITLYEDGRNVESLYLKPDAKYSFQIDCEKQYSIVARLLNFEDGSFEINANTERDKVTVANIELTEVPCNVVVSGVLIDEVTKLPITQAKMYLMRNDQQIDLTATNLRGEYNFTLDCEAEYKISIDKYGYEDGSLTIKKVIRGYENFTISSFLTPIECAQIVNGRISDISSGEPIINAFVIVTDTDGNQVGSENTNNNGNYHITIPCDTKYKVSVSMEDYKHSFKDFTTGKTDAEWQRIDFALTPDICIQSINGVIANSYSKTPIEGSEVTLLKDDIKVNTLLSDENGQFSFEVDCNSNYTVSVTKEDFTLVNIKINTNDVHGADNPISVILKPTLDYIEVRNQLMIVTEDIIFDLNSSDINESSAIELNKVVSTMNKFPEIKVELKSHTDSRAPDNYNLNLSESRAQSMVTYIISKNINPNRITGKGYGETELLNKCSNGVRCSESEHLENRRTEFIVIK